MVKQTSPRTFTNIARKSPNHKPQNSGIFSKSGAGQKLDGTPKPSPSKGPVETRQSAGVMSLRKAVSVPKKKTSMPKTGKSAQKVAQYAIRHGEK